MPTLRLAFDSTMRTFTADGRMHIARSHISKACVNPYRGREIPHWDTLGLEPEKIYQMLRDPEEIARAVDTFKILPVLNRHVSITDFVGMDEQAKKKYIVGSTGSDVEFLKPYLDADVCIWEANAIVGIETDKIREFSCSYRYVPVMTTGIYEGVKYDGIMTQIQGNHLALVEAGRAGNDVLAADHQIGESSMKRTKLGNALVVALTTAFPKVTCANDSELEKVLAPATKKTFERKKALGLILAMDADIDGKQVEAVMDALTDVDDPKPTKKDNEEMESAKDADEHPKGCMCADCKTARDAEPDEDEEDAKKRKAAKDKAKDKAKDAEKVDKSEMKGAMDSLEGKLRSEFKAIEEAKRDVRPTVGDVIAMDSAETIYEFALDHLKIEHEGVTGVPALRSLYKVAASKTAPQVTTTKLAMDHQATVIKRFPGLERFA